MALCAVFLTGGGSKRGQTVVLRWAVSVRCCAAIACWLVWRRYGTLDLGLLDQRAQQLPLGSRYLAARRYRLWSAGQRIIPLHGWVPQAHANASAPAAALFSTVVLMKIGLLGILTLSLLSGNARRFVVGRGAVGAWDDHRLCRWSVRADGA